MQSSILSGLFQESGQTQFSCPGNLCNWTDVTTLGVCASCDDVLASMTTACQQHWQSPQGSFYLNACNFTFSNGPMLQGLVGEAGAGGVYSQTLWNSSGVDLTLSRDESNTPQPALLSAFSAIKIAPFDQPLDELKLEQAMQCGFNFCAKQYSNITSINGTTSLGPFVETDLDINGRYQADDKVMTVLSPDNGTQNFRNTSFTINEADFASLGAYLAELFSVGYTNLNSIDRSTFFNTPSTPVIGSSLQSSPNINDTLKAIAAGMTEAIRTNVNGSSAIGSGYVMKTYIHVSWGWLALPITLMIMTLVLLIRVILMTHRAHVIPWKSSALALLFHSIDSGLQTSHIGNQQDLNDFAGSIHTRLDDDETSLRFKKMN